MIPLFGGASRAGGPHEPAGPSEEAPVAGTFAATTSSGESAAPELSAERGDQWHRSWIVEHDDPARDDLIEGDDDRSGLREAAETALLKKLRSRSLSEREARGVLVAQGLEAHEADAVIDAFLRHGYLDDARLAEQLVHVATDRKAQGRQSVAQTLAARGIPRDVVAATLAELPDDDAERALAFARQKARSMTSLDRDTALRRLHGQLARRGFGGPTAMSAARQALDEAGTRPSSVRFS